MSKFLIKQIISSAMTKRFIFLATFLSMLIVLSMLIIFISKTFHQKSSLFIACLQQKIKVL